MVNTDHCVWHLLLQVFVGRVSILGIVQFTLQDWMGQELVLHISLQP